MNANVLSHDTTHPHLLNLHAHKYIQCTHIQPSTTACLLPPPVGAHHPTQCHVLLPPLTVNSNPVIEVLVGWELHCSFEVQTSMKGSLHMYTHTHIGEEAVT